MDYGGDEMKVGMEGEHICRPWMKRVDMFASF